MSTKHTPGKWWMREGSNLVRGPIEWGEHAICTVHSKKDEALILSSPNLYEAYARAREGLAEIASSYRAAEYNQAIAEHTLKQADVLFAEKPPDDRGVLESKISELLRILKGLYGDLPWTHSPTCKAWDGRDCDPAKCTGCWVIQARAAIAKAEGQEK